MTDRKVGSPDESIRQSQVALKQAMADSTSDEERLSYSLRHDLEPAWSTWIKESGAKPSQIARAVIELAGSLIAETAKNVAQPGKSESLARQMGDAVADKAVYYVSEAPVLAEVDAFRRRDT